MFSVALVAPRLWWHDIYGVKYYTNVIQESYKDKISLEKHGVLYKKLLVEILNLIHKYTYDKHNIIPMYILFQYNPLFIFNLITHIV